MIFNCTRQCISKLLWLWWVGSTPNRDLWNVYPSSYDILCKKGEMSIHMFVYFMEPYEWVHKILSLNIYWLLLLWALGKSTRYNVNYIKRSHKHVRTPCETNGNNIRKSLFSQSNIVYLTTILLCYLGKRIFKWLIYSQAIEPKKSSV